MKLINKYVVKFTFLSLLFVTVLAMSSPSAFATSGPIKPGTKSCGKGKTRENRHP